MSVINCRLRAPIHISISSSVVRPWGNRLISSLRALMLGQVASLRAKGIKLPTSSRPEEQSEVPCNQMNSTLWMFVTSRIHHARLRYLTQQMLRRRKTQPRCSVPSLKSRAGAIVLACIPQPTRMHRLGAQARPQRAVVAAKTRCWVQWRPTVRRSPWLLSTQIRVLRHASSKSRTQRSIWKSLSALASQAIWALITSTKAPHFSCLRTLKVMWNRWISFRQPIK